RLSVDNISYEPRNHVQTASGLNILAGIWLFLSGYALPENDPMVTNNLIAGFLVAAFATFRYVGAYEESWMSWLEVVFGAWIIASPWVLVGHMNHGPTVLTILSNVITGAAVIAFGIWSAMSTYHQRHVRRLHNPVRPTYGM